MKTFVLTICIPVPFFTRVDQLFDSINIMTTGCEQQIELAVPYHLGLWQLDAVAQTTVGNAKKEFTTAWLCAPKLFRFTSAHTEILMRLPRRV